MPKLTDKSELLILAKDDLLHIVDVSDLSSSPEGTSKKIKAEELRKLDIGWRDNIVDFSSTKTNATSEPSWEDIGNGLFAYNFSVGNEVFANYHINHDYKKGTDGFPHVHFLVNQPLDLGDVITWRFDYRIAKGHSQGDSLSIIPSITIDITYTATGTEIAGEHILVECSDEDAFDLLEPDTIVMAKISLLSSNAVGDVFGLMCDLHYQIDRVSTISKSPDFYT